MFHLVQYVLVCPLSIRLLANFLKKIMKRFRDFVKSTSILSDLRTNQSITLNFTTERKNKHDCAVEVTQKLRKSMQCEIS